MKTTSWYQREEDWKIKRSIIFNRDLVRVTFIEVDRLLKLLGDLPAGGKVLDLCCGIGRHSIQFARHGFDVTGVDITKSYLEMASQSAEKAGLSIQFVHSDMREYVKEDTYDLVVNLCTSFGYLESIEDDIKVLENIYASLVQNGTFVIEILGKEVIASTFQKRQELEYEGHKVVATSRILDDWSMLECKRVVTKDGIDQEITAYHRLYSAAELKSYLGEVGFRNIKVYGDFSGAPYDEKAKSMVMIAQK